jgi:hypothetical protein
MLALGPGTQDALIAAVTNSRRTRSGLDAVVPPTAGAGALYLRSPRMVNPSHNPKHLQGQPPR